MRVLRSKSKSVSAYIGQYPANVRIILKKIRKTIQKAAPAAEESISYMMPAYKQNGVLAYFGGFKGHVGFFPTSSGVKAFKKELSRYDVSKGTVRFPLDKPVPYGLIGRIVKFRVKENLHKKEEKTIKTWPFYLCV